MDGEKGKEFRTLAADLFRENKKHTHLTVNLLKRHWAAVVGQDLAYKTHPARIVKQTLWINAKDGSWAYQLQFMKEELLRSVQAYIQCKEITDLRFRMGEVPAMEPIAKEGLGNTAMAATDTAQAASDPASAAAGDEGRDRSSAPRDGVPTSAPQRNVPSSAAEVIPFATKVGKKPGDTLQPDPQADHYQTVEPVSIAAPTDSFERLRRAYKNRRESPGSGSGGKPT